MFYFNQEKFYEQGYDEDSITRESVIMSIQASITEPSWADFKVQTSQLNDQTSLFQLGNA